MARPKKMYQYVQVANEVYAVEPKQYVKALKLVAEGMDADKALEAVGVADNPAGKFLGNLNMKPDEARKKFEDAIIDLLD